MMYNYFNCYCSICGDYIPANTYHHSCPRFNKDGCYCPKCGVWIESDVAHICQRVFDEEDILRYNYKCPECQGEFNTPAINGIDSTATGNPKCPFCGYTMKGLN